MSKMILCTDIKNGIGLNNTIPWHSTEDFKHFKAETENKVIVMGYNTWKSLPKKPLPNRLNIVLLSREYKNREPLETGTNVLFLDVLNLKSIIDNNPDCIIIGGSRIYEKAIEYVDEIILSVVPEEHDCDTYFNIHQYNKNLELQKTKTLNDGIMVYYYKKEN